MDTNAGFSRKRLPHVEGMTEQQHALITLINAACYVTDEESKQVLFCTTLRACRNKSRKLNPNLFVFSFNCAFSAALRFCLFSLD